MPAAAALHLGAYQQGSPAVQHRIHNHTPAAQYLLHLLKQQLLHHICCLV
jgi:hypothetical protein